MIGWGRFHFIFNFFLRSTSKKNKMPGRTFRAGGETLILSLILFFENFGFFIKNEISS